MSGGEQQTSATFDRPAQFARGTQQDLLAQIFGSPAVSAQAPQFMFGRQISRGRPGQEAQPGVGLQGLESIFGQFTSPLQQQAMGGFAQFLGQPSPESRAFAPDTAFGALQSILGGGSGASIVGAARPVFERNLATAQSQLAAQTPGRFSSAFLQQGTDLAGRALQDFNLFAAQAQQQDIAQRIQAALAGGQLAQVGGQLGQIPIQNRMAMQALVLQLLQGLGQPTGQRQSGGGGLGSLLGGLLGFGAGSFLGPLAGAAGASLGGRIFNSGGGGGGGGGSGFGGGIT